MLGMLGSALAMGLAGCGSRGATTNGADQSVSAAAAAAPEPMKLKAGDSFPSFTATDLVSGAKLDESLFAVNKVTVVTYWFNGCSACVNEMPALQQLADDYRDKGVGVIGSNADVPFDASLAKEAKEILAKQGVSYPNLAMDTDSEGGKLISGIMAFPTTFLVDQKGKLIGDPIEGSFDKLEDSELLRRIEDALAKA